MTLLEILASVSKSAGVAVPTVAATSTDDEYVKLVQFSAEACEEIARRADWSALRNTATIVGTGANDDFALPSDFDRLTIGGAVVASGNYVRGGLTTDEWLSLTPAVGAPRFFRVNGQSSINFHPYPALAASISVSYQSKNWCSNGSEAWEADDDTPLVPSDLVVKGTIWRWKRYVGQDYSDYLAEFEAALADRVSFEARDRTP